MIDWGGSIQKSTPTLIHSTHQFGPQRETANAIEGVLNQATRSTRNLRGGCAHTWGD